MKFTYDEKADRGECVAYVGEKGTKFEFLSVKAGGGSIVFYKDGDIERAGFWSPDKEADHVFMKGDSITITF